MPDLPQASFSASPFRTSSLLSLSLSGCLLLLLPIFFQAVSSAGNFVPHSFLPAHPWPIFSYLSGLGYFSGNSHSECGGSPAVLSHSPCAFYSPGAHHTFLCDVYLFHWTSRARTMSGSFTAVLPASSRVWDQINT